MSHYIFENDSNQACFYELVALLLCHDVAYIVVETDFMEHHIEKVPRTNCDRGNVKWIAETKPCAYEKMEKCEKARKSHIDGGDCFPRFYFHSHSFVHEFLAFLSVRHQDMERLKVPLEFSPNFDAETYVKSKLWQMMPEGSA